MPPHARRTVVSLLGAPAFATCAAAALSTGFLIVAHAMPPTAQDPGPGWTLTVLGIAQDGGMPHLGCQRHFCADARAGRRPAERVSSLGLVHEPSGRAYLFDATPDMPAQLDALTGGAAPDGIFLTHGHIGHYTGLVFLGKEVLAADGVTVYGTRRMADFLTSNGPWSLLVSDGHIALDVVAPDEPLALGDGLRVTAFTVPHRDEFTDTVGYRIDGPRASALFIPDVDRWDRWDRDIRALVDDVDLAFLDGTFSSADEIAGRSFDEIRHPLIPDTRRRLAGTGADVWFIHLNHSNPALAGAPDVAREGMAFGL
ncbi:MAG: MBL fold metallo-hydrolase [Acidobacteria bacterium]|nr:MBL fold metallo-hydrolase [Acidobacteriota bacterium]